MVVLAVSTMFGAWPIEKRSKWMNHFITSENESTLAGQFQCFILVYNIQFITVIHGHVGAWLVGLFAYPRRFLDSDGP